MEKQLERKIEIERVDDIWRQSKMKIGTCPFCQGDVIVFWKGIYCPACQVEWADEEDMNADLGDNVQADMFGEPEPATDGAYQE